MAEEIREFVRKYLAEEGLTVGPMFNHEGSKRLFVRPNEEKSVYIFNSESGEFLNKEKVAYEYL